MSDGKDLPIKKVVETSIEAASTVRGLMSTDHAVSTLEPALNKCNKAS
jgi:hypothetical protein